MNSGLYIITNTTNGHRYVGSAVNLGRRWCSHRFYLHRGAHHSVHLQRAWDKYGEDTFRFEILEEWELEFLVSMEQWWMNMLAPEYNISPTAGSSLGRKHSPETRTKTSAAMMGNKNCLARMASPETRDKISAAKNGHRHSAETIAKISAANRGRKRTSEQLERISAAQKRRWSAERAAAELTGGNT